MKRHPWLVEANYADADLEGWALVYGEPAYLSKRDAEARCREFRERTSAVRYRATRYVPASEEGRKR